MATITLSETLEEINRGSHKRCLYRYTLSTGEVHLRRGWLPVAADTTADRTARGTYLLDMMAASEIDQVLG